MGEDRLAGAGLALDEQRPLERDRCVDSDLQILRRDIGVGALEPLHVLSRCHLPVLFCHCERSEAISRRTELALRDCFVATLLAMTVFSANPLPRTRVGNCNRSSLL